ncbi:MAG: TetR/AcrR family transcriptional regulator [Coriobacteriia bacterium]|nr:TetR/AcrR family transcriptional regulator [Coriobacteriia bacterium]
MDERSVITEESLKIALLQQMEQLGFQKITVSSLTAKAGVNRTTFYLHYADKYDLLDQVENELLGYIRESLPTSLKGVIESRSPRKLINEVLLKVLNFIKEHEFEFTVLLGLMGDPGFAVKYEQMINDAFTSEQLPFTAAMPIEYLVAVVSGAHISIIRAWLLRGMQESPEEMAGIVTGLILSVRQGLAKL